MHVVCINIHVYVFNVLILLDQLVHQAQQCSYPEAGGAI